MTPWSPQLFHPACLAPSRPRVMVKREWDMGIKYGIPMEDDNWGD
jgi:hypothetical protein